MIARVKARAPPLHLSTSATLFVFCDFKGVYVKREKKKRAHVAQTRAHKQDLHQQTQTDCAANLLDGGDNSFPLYHLPVSHNRGRRTQTGAPATDPRARTDTKTVKPSTCAPRVRHGHVHQRQQELAFCEQNRSGLRHGDVRQNHTHTHLHKTQSQNSRPVRTAAALPFMAAWDAFLNIGAFFNMSGSTMKRTLLPRMYTVSSCARFVSHPRQKRVFLKYGTPPPRPSSSILCLPVEKTQRTLPTRPSLAVNVTS
jgi:hypothetical protein